MNRPELRIGDLEREGAVSALGEHYVAGRLTKDEFDERAAVAWRARTSSELAPLFADLPPLHGGRRGAPAAVPAASVPAQQLSRGQQHPRLGVLPLLLVFVALMMLTEQFWVVMLVMGVLWWSGAFRWLARVTSGRPAATGGARRSRC